MHEQSSGSIERYGISPYIKALPPSIATIAKRVKKAVEEMEREIGGYQ